MHIGIVERIAADYLRLVVTVAGAEGDAVDLAPGHRQVEHLLPADERNVLFVGHPAVKLGIEPGQRIAAHAQRGADAVESVYDQHVPFLVGHAAGGDDLAGKTLPAFVHGGHLVAVNAPRFLLGKQTGLVGITAVVEAAVVDARIDHITGRGGSRFERIHHGRPRNGHLAVSGELRGEGLHRQRLHYIR